MSSIRALVLVGIAAFLVLVAVVGWATRSEEPPPEYRVDGLRAVDAAELLAEADEVFGDSPAAWRSDESRCFFSQPRARGELNPFLRCGPVFRTLRHGIDPWDTYAIFGAPSDSGFALELGPRIETESKLEVGEVLSRPDGLEPVDDEPTFPNATPAPPDTPTYPYDSWETAFEFEQCMAVEGVRAFDVTATVTDPQTVELIEFVVASFDGVTAYDLVIDPVDGITGSIDPDDPLAYVADGCVRRADTGYLNRVRLDQEYFPP